jgi:predicted MFS family arabinose efflux permease
MLAAITYGVIEGPRRGWGSVTIVGLFILGAVAAALLVVAELRRREPLIDVRLFRGAPFAGASVIAVAAFGALGGFLFLNTLYLQDVRGYTPVRAGLLTIPMAVMIAVFAQVSGRLVGRRGPRIPFALAGPALVIAAVLLARLTTHTPVSYLVLAYVIFGIGSGLVAAPITSTAVAGMPTAQAGVAGAIASTGRQVGAALGVAVTGSIVATTASASFVAASHAAWLVIAGCGLAVLVVGLVSTGPWAQRTAARTSDRLVPLPQEGSNDRAATASR